MLSERKCSAERGRLRKRKIVSKAKRALNSVFYSDPNRASLTVWPCPGRAFVARSIPQYNSRHYQVEAAEPVALLLKAAVADFHQPVEKHSSGQRVAGFAFVQLRHGVLCDPNYEVNPN